VLKVEIAFVDTIDGGLSIYLLLCVIPGISGSRGFFV
jgi:hypothetical protein